MKELKDEISRLHAENATLQAGYDAARLEIEALRSRQCLHGISEPSEYPPLPTGSAWCGDDDVRDFGAGAGESALMFEPTQTQHVPLFTAGQMRAYVDADRAMRAKAAPAAAAGQCEDAIELLGKYKELCEEIKRGDSYHIGRIDAAISVLAQAAPQPAVQQGAPVAWRSWDSENSRWNFTLWADEWVGHADVWEPLYTYPAAPVAQGDALTPAARDVLAELERVTDDLAALVRKLVRSLRKTAPDNELADKALDYLKRKGLQGSPLRHNSPSSADAKRSAATNS